MTRPTTTTDTDDVTHPVLLYRDADEFLAGTVAFVTEAISAGIPVALATPGERLDLLRGALGPRTVNVRSINLDTVGRNPGRVIADVMLRFADEYPSRPVRIVTEVMWPGRRPFEYLPCLQHEALVNLALRGRRADILCPYDVSRLDPVAVTDAAITHPTVIEKAVSRTSGAFDPGRALAMVNQPLSMPADGRTLEMLVNLGNLSQARQYAAARGADLGLPAAALDNIRLAVSELAGNSVRHGGGYGLLSVWAQQGHVVCQVRDRGAIADPMAGRRPTSLAAIDGRGLLLVNRLADLVRVHTGAGGTTVQVYFELPTNGP